MNPYSKFWYHHNELELPIQFYTIIFITEQTLVRSSTVKTLPSAKRFNMFNCIMRFCSILNAFNPVPVIMPRLSILCTNLHSTSFGSSLQVPNLPLQLHLEAGSRQPSCLHQTKLLDSSISLQQKGKQHLSLVYLFIYVYT